MSEASQLIELYPPQPIASTPVGYARVGTDRVSTPASVLNPGVCITVEIVRASSIDTCAVVVKLDPPPPPE